MIPRDVKVALSFIAVAPLALLFPEAQWFRFGTTADISAVYLIL